MLGTFFQFFFRVQLLFTVHCFIITNIFFPYEERVVSQRIWFMSVLKGCICVCVCVCVCARCIKLGLYGT